MNFDEAFLQKAHKHCFKNLSEVENSKLCGCFYCQKTFEPSKIDHENDVDEESSGGGKSVTCPHCFIDAVIGDASGFPVIDVSFLKAMHEFWFERTVHVRN